VIRKARHAKLRPGAIAPLVALLLIPLLMVVACAVDLGWVVMVQSELQNAADAAALAGAGQLMDGYVQYNLPGQTSSQQTAILSTAKTNAKTYAKQLSAANSAGRNSVTLLDGDIEFGFTDASGAYTPSSTGYPNTVKVTTRRDATANSPLGLFFGPVVGLSSVNLKASAAACSFTANIDSFSNVSNFKAGLLPMTYDVNHWNAFLATGKGPDGTLLTDSNGVPQLKIYSSVKDEGNFGLLGLDDTHVGASTISSWISNGMTQTDLQTLLSNSASGQTPLVPLSQHNQSILPSMSSDGHGSWNWVGDTGMKTSDVHTLNNYLGSVYLLPLYKPLDPSSSTYTAGDGNGSHYYYNIVQFVSVKIISTSGKDVYVEPSAKVLDFSFETFSGKPSPAGTYVPPTGSPSLLTTFTPPKLTQ
jgi:Flp pilus assembly protein TadG